MDKNKEIWLSIARGDETAFAEMYLHYFKRFYVYGKKITAYTHIIEDAIHDVMLKIWQNRASLAGIKNPAAYYYTSFRNTLFDKLKMQSNTISDDGILGLEESSSEELIVETEVRIMHENKLKQSFSELTPRQLEAVFLRFYHKMPYEDVASVLGITVKATYKLIARSMEKLKNDFILVLLILNVLGTIFSIR